MTPTLARPPEIIDAGPASLRRAVVDDAAALARAVGESLDHLRAWMPWATPRAATPEAQVEFLQEITLKWDHGTDFAYFISLPDETGIQGMIGLHRRVGPGGIEIGYWVHAAYGRRGLALAAAGAVTAAALELPDVERVEIHTDEANVRSASIPAKLGYRLDRIDCRQPQAPSETGRMQIWLRP